MPNPNPYTLPRPKLRQETRTFTDPAQPGVEITLTFRALDGLEALKVGGDARRLIEEWAPSEANGFISHIPLPDGELLEPSEDLLQTVAMLVKMQVPPGEGDLPYDLIAWLGVATRFPSAWLKILEWAGELSTAGSNREGNP